LASLAPGHPLGYGGAVSDPSIVLYHHPFSRASTVVWMLEEVGVPYTLEYVDLSKGEQKAGAVIAHNPMGKLPVLVDGPTVVSETAAIGLYLADRYAPGRLAPALDAPERGTYLRWSVFGAAVVEPAAMAHAAKWQYGPGQAGFGTYEAMVASLEHAVGAGPWLLGERFSMADVTLGATIRYMLMFKMLDPRPALTAYVERLNARPANLAAAARNQAVVEARGLEPRG
jgi:glutathione S-transferase